MPAPVLLLRRLGNVLSRREGQARSFARSPVPMREVVSALVSHLHAAEGPRRRLSRVPGDTRDGPGTRHPGRLDRPTSVCNSLHMRPFASSNRPRDDQFGPILRHARMERGLTQEQLADISGLHRTEISLLERGQRKPLLETVVALCRGLGVTPAELLHEVKL